MFNHLAKQQKVFTRNQSQHSLRLLSSKRWQQKDMSKQHQGNKQQQHEQHEQQQSDSGSNVSIHRGRDSPLSSFFGGGDTSHFFNRDMRNMMKLANTLWNQFPSFDNALQGMGRGGMSGGWMPAIDVKETRDSIELDAEVPGMKKEDIKLEFDEKNRLLTMRGESKFEKEKKDSQWHTVERRYGEFQRSIQLPENAKPEEIKANYKDGVLKVTIPKGEEKQQVEHIKNISIQ